MFGDKKKIKELQEQYSFLSSQYEILQENFLELSSELSNLKKESDQKAIENMQEFVKSDTLSKFKDNDGMYNYKLYKQKKMGLGGFTDEETK